MIKSIWLEKYEEQTKAKRDQSMKGKNIVFIVLPIMLAINIIAAIA